MPEHKPAFRYLRCRRVGWALACLASFAVLLVLLVNLSWFDEPLLPQIEALRQARSVPIEGNGYPLAMGFLAAASRDPRAAGVELIHRLRERRDRGEAPTIGDEQRRAILGTPTADVGMESTLGFQCQARHRLDCAERLVNRIATLDLNSPQAVLLFSRYETLLREMRFVETPEAGLDTPYPPLGPLRALGRLRLAMSLRADATPEFLEKVSQELAFWRLALRDADRMGMKMSSLAAIRQTHDFVGCALRAREFGASDLELLRRTIRPFTREERNIGAAFVAEARAYLLSSVTPEARNTSWLTRLMLQENATLNQFFREAIEPMRVRSSLGAREYLETGADEPLRRELRWTPAVFYNFGGKWALSRSPWDAHQFPLRVHDEDGRISLLLLQAEIEEHPDVDIGTLVRDSAHRNPYTGEAMVYDAREGTIGFACMHTAFHPPELADHCAVALGRPE